MVTEQTKKTDREGQRGWVLYDGDCPMCVRLAGRFSSVLRRRRFDLAPLQTPWVRSRIGLREGERPTEMLVLTNANRLLRGADAAVFLARRIWWAWPLWVWAQLPAAMPLIRCGYRWVARNRACFGGQCARPERPNSDELRP